MAIGTPDQELLNILHLLLEIADDTTVNPNEDPYLATSTMRKNLITGTGPRQVARLETDFLLSGDGYRYLMRAIAQLAVDLGGPTLAATGTILTTPTEGEVVTGGQTIILTLTGATWATDVVTNATKLAALRKGLVSRDSEAAGWNAKIRAVLTATEIVRTSDTVVTITLPAAASYAITAADDVDVLVPAVCVSGDYPMYDPDLISIQPD